MRVQWFYTVYDPDTSLLFKASSSSKPKAKAASTSKGKAAKAAAEDEGDEAGELGEEDDVEGKAAAKPMKHPTYKLGGSVPATSCMHSRTLLAATC